MYADRRKGNLITQTIQTLVNATFLLLAAMLIYDRWDNNTATEGLIATKKELHDSMQANVYYLEGKVNRVAESSDSYQVNVNGRIQVLETRMTMLENRRVKDTARITNTNTAISNGAPQEPNKQQ